ncbi:hypothetical protein BU17DRAFT_70659 [Hysterangium stoloniferum]|nr:hypothetical protein BU17DRAFT_70659 [Hysterangium stoloniferum]
MPVARLMHGGFLIAALVNGLTSIPLAAILLTICLSDTVHRHPVFVNFILVSVFYSASLFVSDMAYMTLPKDITTEHGIGMMVDNREYSLTIAFILSSMSLLIHLGFLMRSAFHQELPRTAKARTVVLIILPYILSFLPIGMFFEGEEAIFSLGLTMFMYSNEGENTRGLITLHPGQDVFVFFVLDKELMLGKLSVLKIDEELNDVYQFSIHLCEFFIRFLYLFYSASRTFCIYGFPAVDELYDWGFHNSYELFETDTPSLATNNMIIARIQLLPVSL